MSFTLIFSDRTPLPFLKFPTEVWLCFKRNAPFFSLLACLFPVVLDLRSCSPKCEIHFITLNPEYLYKSPTSLSPLNKETVTHLSVRKDFEIIFLFYSGVRAPMCIICWRSYHMYTLMQTSHSRYTTMGLCFNWFFHFLSLWSDHRPISWDVATQNVVHGTPGECVETESQRADPRHNESEFRQ